MPDERSPNRKCACVCLDLMQLEDDNLKIMRVLFYFCYNATQQQLTGSEHKFPLNQSNQWCSLSCAAAVC